MLLQLDSNVMFIIWLVLATVLVWLILFLAVYLIDSKNRASDKKLILLLIAFLAVLIVPVVVGAIGSVLGAIGGLLADLRTAIYPSGQDYLSQLAPIIGFLLLLILVKWLVADSWENSLWISLITYFILFLFYCIAPELYIVIQLG